MRMFNPGRLLPDVPDRVHGIKGVDPYVVQCDDCFSCWESRSLIRVVRMATFAVDPDVRLCDSCWLVRGWVAAKGRWTRGDS